MAAVRHFLDIICTSLHVILEFSIPALTQGRQYIGPLEGFATACSCSSVTYSMVSACGACQGQGFDTCVVTVSFVPALRSLTCIV